MLRLVTQLTIQASIMSEITEMVTQVMFFYGIIIGIPFLIKIIFYNKPWPMGNAIIFILFWWAIVGIPINISMYLLKYFYFGLLLQIIVNIIGCIITFRILVSQKIRVK